MRSSDHELSMGTVPANGPKGGSQQKTQAKIECPAIIICCETETDSTNYTPDSDVEANPRQLVDTGEESWIGPYF